MFPLWQAQRHRAGSLLVLLQFALLLWLGLMAAAPLLQSRMTLLCGVFWGPVGCAGQLDLVAQPSGQFQCASRAQDKWFAGHQRAVSADTSPDVQHGVAAGRWPGLCGQPGIGVVGLGRTFRHIAGQGVA